MRAFHCLVIITGLVSGCSTTSVAVKAVAALPAPQPLQFVTLPSPQPVVTFRLVFHTGSIDDPKGKEGLTSLTSNILVEGGTVKLSASQLQSALFPMAAELHIQTDKEFTVLSGRVHKDKLAHFKEMLVDVLLEPRFDEKEFLRLRADAINRVKNRLRNENDETLGKVALDALLYPSHPYGHYTGGTVSALESIRLDDVKAHYQNVFSQDRLVVGLAGAFDEALVGYLKEQLTKLPARGAARVALPHAASQAGKTLILEKETLSTAISMGHAYPLRRDHPDYFAVALALSYLGEHRQFHGVLFQELREKRGLNYGNYAYVENFVQEGGSTLSQVNIGRSQQAFSIWIRPVEPPNAVFATKAALYFLEELRRSPPPTERLETAKGFLQGYTRVWEQTDERRLGYAIDEVFYGTPAFLKRFREAIERMTPEEVQKAAQKHLSVEKLSFVYVTQNARALQEALLSPTTPTMEYPSPKPQEVLEVDKHLQKQPAPFTPERIEVRDAQMFMEK